MRTRASVFVAAGILMMSVLPSVAEPAGVTAAVAQRPAYLDAHAPIKRRVEDLLSRMTVQEKIGQMTQAERGALSPPVGDPAPRAFPV